MNSSSLGKQIPASLVRSQKFSWQDFVEELRTIQFDYPNLKIAYLAQCMLESGNGKSDLFRLAGNPTGIKWRREMEGVADPYLLVTPTEPQGEHWCSWDTPRDAIEGYWHFIGRPVYDGWEHYAQDPNAYLQYIFNCGYATDPRYVKKVTRLFSQAEALLDMTMSQILPHLPTTDLREDATWFRLDFGYG